MFWFLSFSIHFNNSGPYIIYLYQTSVCHKKQSQRLNNHHTTSDKRQCITLTQMPQYHSQPTLPNKKILIHPIILFS